MAAGLAFIALLASTGCSQPSTEASNADPRANGGSNPDAGPDGGSNPDAGPGHGLGTLDPGEPGVTPASDVADPTAANGSAATITEFAMPPTVACGDAADIAVPVTYATTAATTVAFILDGAQLSGTPPASGPYDVSIPCDGRAHTVVLAVVDAEGRPIVRSVAVLTEPAPASAAP